MTIQSVHVLSSSNYENVHRASPISHTDSLTGRTVVRLLGRSARGNTTRSVSDKVAVSKIGVATIPICLFGLDALVNEPEGVDMTRQVTQDGQEDVDEQVTAAAGDDSGGGWREDDGDKNEDDVRTSDRHLDCCSVGELVKQ